MSRTLRMGDQGGDVRAVQDVLNFHIRRLEALHADGKFGSFTKSRVVEFQQANALQPDGIVGNETKKKLFENEEEEEDPAGRDDPAVVVPDPQRMENQNQSQRGRFSR